MNLKEYMKRTDTDPYLKEKLQHVDIENLLDEAIELLEEVVETARYTINIGHLENIGGRRLNRLVNEFYKYLEE